MARKDPGKPHEYEGLFLTVEFFWTFAGLAVCYEGGNSLEGKNVLCNLVHVVPYALKQ